MQQKTSFPNLDILNKTLSSLWVDKKKWYLNYFNSYLVNATKLINKILNFMLAKQFFPQCTWFVNLLCQLKPSPCLSGYFAPTQCLQVPFSIIYNYYLMRSSKEWYIKWRRWSDMNFVIKKEWPITWKKISAIWWNIIWHSLLTRRTKITETLRLPPPPPTFPTPLSYKFWARTS